VHSGLSNRCPSHFSGEPRREQVRRVVALGPHRGAQLGARGDAERGARRVVGLELGQELV
jgi:hypothetical protein